MFKLKKEQLQKEVDDLAQVLYTICKEKDVCCVVRDQLKAKSAKFEQLADGNKFISDLIDE